MPRTATPVVTTHLVPGDVLRVLALVSVVVAAWQWGVIGGLLLLLVLGGTLIPRAVGAPRLLDAAYCASLLVAAWAAQLDWYVAVPWLDIAVHAVATALVAVVVCLTLERWSGVDRAALGPRGLWVAAVLVSTTGATLGLLWELGEWFGHTYLDDRIQVGYTDTIGDLAAGLVGSVVAGLLVARSVRGAR